MRLALVVRVRLVELVWLALVLRVLLGLRLVALVVLRVSRT